MRSALMRRTTIDPASDRDMRDQWDLLRLSDYRLPDPPQPPPDDRLQWLIVHASQGLLATAWWRP